MGNISAKGGEIMLTSRQLLVFKSIVEEFIETAEPVGSKTLMTKYCLPYSSATIRSEMSFLEEHGYLEKTHTSSGRVPSVEGYRFYVETLEENDIDDNIKYQVANIFQDRNRSLNEIVRESCEILSELTNLTSVVLGPNAMEDCLQRITVVPIQNNRVTAIIITDQGHVENKAFEISDDISLEDLQNCVEIMNDMLVGTPLDKVASKLNLEVKPILGAKIDEHEALFSAFLEAFVKFASNDVYFSGKENMLYQPEYNDVNTLRNIVRAFENSQIWKSLTPISFEEGVSVKIGTDSPIDELKDVSVISASFNTGQQGKGSIAVIGPTRMPYEKVVSLVEFISKSIEQAFEEEDYITLSNEYIETR